MSFRKHKETIIGLLKIYVNSKGNNHLIFDVYCQYMDLLSKDMEDLLLIDPDVKHYVDIINDYDL